MEFIRSLAGSKADQFRGMVRDTLSEGEEIPSSEGGENDVIDVEEIGRRRPEMVLAESYEDLGTQLERGEGTFADGSFPDAVPASRTISRQSQRQTPGEPVSAETDLFPARRAVTSDTAAAEIMKRRLNNFQIERLAETIKERLESELKIQKERWGEEP